MKSLLVILGHQNWIRFGIRDRILRFFHNPDAKQDQPFKTTFFGTIYPGNFNNFIDWSVHYYGAYTKDELICMRDFMSGARESVMVDVGANIGHHTLFASQIADHVHSFEPFAPVQKKLEEKIRINNLSNVTLHKIGLGNVNESLKFSPPESNNMGTGSFHPDSTTDGSGLLMVRRADDYFETAGVHKIDYLKMDIEGYEVEALKGMKETLNKHRPVVFFEWTQADKSDGLSNGSELFPAGYSFYKFRVNEPILFVFNREGYSLHELLNDWNDGNILAVPDEFLDRREASRAQIKLARAVREI